MDSQEIDQTYYGRTLRPQLLESFHDTAKEIQFNQPPLSSFLSMQRGATPHDILHIIAMSPKIYGREICDQAQTMLVMLSELELSIGEKWSQALEVDILTGLKSAFRDLLVKIQEQHIAKGNVEEVEDTIHAKTEEGDLFLGNAIKDTERRAAAASVTNTDNSTAETVPNEEKIGEEKGKETVDEEKEIEKASGDEEENNEEDSLDGY